MTTMAMVADPEHNPSTLAAQLAEAEVDEEVVALRRYLTTVLPQHTRVERLRLVPWLLTQGVLGVPWDPFAPP